MKKLMIILLTAFLLFGCKEKEEIIDPIVYDDAELLLLDEMENSFNFFWEQANTDENSGGYGLINDRYPSNVSLASIASVGFGLAGLPIGVDFDFITQEEGYERANKTLDTFLNMENYHGFFYHFLNKATGERAGTSEVSIIDSAFLFAGASTAGEYFGGEVKTKAEQLYAQVDWNWYLNKTTHQFYMGYRPESGFAGAWNWYGEQLILYVLGAGAPNEAYRTGQLEYNSFNRRNASYKGEYFISSWFGSLFTYQFSHAFIDFRNTEDQNGVNWFENSVNATIANRQYSIDTNPIFSTFTSTSWGMTASDGPTGYSGYYGAKPSGTTDDAHRNDGTIAPAGALGSVVFLSDQVKKSVTFFETIGGLKGEYGYKDAYNFDYAATPWIAGDVIGIDKGVTMMMIANYFDDTVWTYFMQNQYIQNGLALIGIEEVEQTA